MRHAIGKGPPKKGTSSFALTPHLGATLGARLHRTQADDDRSRSKVTDEEEVGWREEIVEIEEEAICPGFCTLGLCMMYPFIILLPFISQTNILTKLSYGTWSQRDEVSRFNRGSSCQH